MTKLSPLLPRGLAPAARYRAAFFFRKRTNRSRRRNSVKINPMRSRPKLALIALLFAVEFVWAQSSPVAQPSQAEKSSDSQTEQSSDSQKSAAQKSQQPELAPASRSGPKVAPENERPIAKAPRRSNSTLPLANCVGAVNTTDCLSNAAPPNIPVQPSTARSPEDPPKTANEQPKNSEENASDESG